MSEIKYASENPDYDDGACLTCGAGSDENCTDDCDCDDCQDNDESWVHDSDMEDR